jgi:hypothetical protein
MESCSATTRRSLRAIVRRSTKKLVIFYLNKRGSKYQSNLSEAIVEEA